MSVTMSHREGQPSRSGRIVRVCVGVSVATVALTVGLAVVAIRLEDSPPTITALLTLAALAIVWPVAALV